MKHKYRGGRPKGIKNGESSISKGKLWETEEEKEALWQKAKEKIANMNFKDTPSTYHIHHNYKQWVVNLTPYDLDGLTNEEIDEIVYKYKGNKSLWLRGTKEDDFDGKY